MTATLRAVPTDEQISSTLQLFRSELDKNMHNSSGSPGHDAMRVALCRLFAAAPDAPPALPDEPTDAMVFVAAQVIADSPSIDSPKLAVWAWMGLARHILTDAVLAGGAGGEVMKERPILFSAPMVRAILDGRKTQTRRVVKPQPALSFIVACDEPGTFGDEEGEFQFKCPYGQPGDRLWVRENGWERPERSARDMREGADTWKRYYYDADGETGEDLKAWGFKRRPSIHMPRWASRITLELTGVRVERLQDISGEDAQAEGAQQCARREVGLDSGCASYVCGYQQLWCSINGAGAWDANPWVWVVEFKRA